MSKLPTDWQPLSIEALKDELEGFTDWVLCGGYSVARITGEDTRAHGDIDVGVFRSQLRDCLAVLGRERVQLCHGGNHHAWDGRTVPEEVHDIWITDREQRYWAMQVMVFDDEGEEVVYRRDRRIRWPKEFHSLEIDGIKVLNPLISVLFKTNKPSMEEKEVHDVIQLIKHMGKGSD